jgi:hypothetical protein
LESFGFEDEELLEPVALREFLYVEQLVGQAK